MVSIIWFWRLNVFLGVVVQIRGKVRGRLRSQFAQVKNFYFFRACPSTRWRRGKGRAGGLGPVEEGGEGGEDVDYGGFVGDGDVEGGLAGVRIFLDEGVGEGFWAFGSFEDFGYLAECGEAAGD